MIHRCSNPAGWHPTLHSKQDHHHPPLAWRRVILNHHPDADQSWWRIIRLCGLCHDEYHTLANAYVRTGDVPPYRERRTYGPFIRELVAEAWAHRVRGAKMPYTVSR